MASKDIMAEERFKEFVLRITQIYIGMQKLKLSEMESLDLKGAHVMCLFELGRHPGGLSGAELARRCAVDRAAVSRVVADLKQRGIVEVKTGEAKRSYRAPVTLTRKGQEVSERLDGKISRVIEKISGDFTAEERTFFYGALAQIAENLQREVRGEQKGADAIGSADYNGFGE